MCYKIKVKDSIGVAMFGRYHSPRHAEIGMRVNGISGEVVKSEPYELATFTIQHEFNVFNLLNGKEVRL